MKNKDLDKILSIQEEILNNQLEIEHALDQIEHLSLVINNTVSGLRFTHNSNINKLRDLRKLVRKELEDRITESQNERV